MDRGAWWVSLWGGKESGMTERLIHNQNTVLPLLLLLLSRFRVRLCATLCNPIDGSPPGSPVLRILQARTLEWVAISFSPISIITLAFSWFSLQSVKLDNIN